MSDAPKFKQIAVCIASGGEESPNDERLYALDTEGRVWFWRDATSHGQTKGEVSGWAGPLDELYIPIPKRNP